MLGLRLPVVALALVCVASSSWASFDSTFTYQGRLKESGQPFNGPADLVFDLYDLAAGGLVLGTQAVNGVTVTDGVFTVALNAGGEFGANAFVGQPRWLQITVNGSPLTPRQPLTATPDALHAQNASGLSLPFTGSASVGAPGEALRVTNTGTGVAMSGQSDGASGTGVYGVASSTTGFTFGGNFVSNSPDGRAIRSTNTATTGLGVAGRFSSASTSGIGIWSTANAATGATYGGYFESQSADNPIGVYGYTPAFLSAAHSIGVFGRSDSGSFNGGGVGVYGLATSPFNPTYGVWGENMSTEGVGVMGRALANQGTTFGVYGLSNSPFGFDFYAAGTGLNYGAASSVRWKHDVVSIDDPLDKLAAIRGVYFTWDAEHGGHHDVGFIAEEVGEVLPEVVAYEEDGQYATGMDYGKVTPLLVEAVNALRAEKDAQIAELRQTNDALRARLETIEAAVEAKRGRD